MSRRSTHNMRAAVHELAEQLETRRWQGGVRVVVQGAMRAPIANGNVSLEASWRADVYYDNPRTPAFTLVAETPASLLRDLADFVEQPIAL